MIRLVLTTCLYLACQCAAPALSEAGDVHVFVGGTILSGTGQEYSPGALVIEDGKIVAVGAEKNLSLPEGATRHDMSGKVVIPGLVDSHSHIGLFGRPSAGGGDGNESTAPVQAIVRALDSLNPFDPGIRMAVAGGVTTANIMPGSANVIGGQTIYVKLRGHTPEQMWLGPDESLGGLKMANGENPKRSYGSRGQAPGTRMKVAALQRSEFLKAQNYQREWEKYRRERGAGKDPTPPAVDLALEPLVEVLERRRTVHFHSHRADDILTTLRLQEEFGFDLVIQHGTESFKVAEQIARRNVPVSLTILDSPGGKAEVVDLLEECGAELTRAGVTVLINTDDPITESRLLLRSAATAVRGGMSETDALRAITIHPARAMKLDHRLGSLEEGKDADFVVLSGRPFSVYTRVEETWIDGKKEFDLTRDEDRRYQTGGFANPGKDLPEPQTERVQPELVRQAPEGRDRPEVDTEVTEFQIFVGRLYPVAGEPIDDGVIHVRKGRIVYAGRARGRDDRRRIPCLRAAAATPGMIDAHSVVPLTGEYNIPADQDANEQSDTNQADLRSLDAFHPGEPLLKFLLQNGVTLVHACPGRANVIAGLSGVFRTHGRVADEMAVKFPLAMVINLGEEPKGHSGSAPGTRMGTAALVRRALSGAVEYKRRNSRKKEDEPQSRDLKNEHLQLALDGTIASFFCAQRADDLLTALRLSDEFNLRPILSLAADAYRIRDELVRAEVPIVVHPTMQRPDRLETYGSTFRNAALLDDAGLSIAVGSGFEGYVPKTRVVRHEAALAMAYGLEHARALHAVTLGAAGILGIDDRYGSLERGKVADIVLYDGDPFEYATHVVAVFVDGRLVYRRGDEPARPLADRLEAVVPEVPCCNWW